MEDHAIYEAIYNAMDNSYKVIVEKKDPYIMMDEAEDEVVFAHHIDETITVEEIQNMIKWWEQPGIEKYERCAELKHIENEIKRLSKRNKGKSVTNN